MKCYHCRKDCTPAAMIPTEHDNNKVRLCLACYTELTAIENIGYTEMQQRVRTWWNKIQEEKPDGNTK